MILYLQRLLRAGVISALGFGGGVGLFVFILLLVKGGANATSHAVKVGIFLGLVFSAALIFLMVILDLIAKFVVAGKLKQLPKDIWDIEQSREVELDGSLKQIALSCRQALLAVPSVANVLDDAERRHLKAQTCMSLRSPGEELEVFIDPVNASDKLEESKWKARCVSRPKTKEVLFDYGKNFENVEIWRQHVLSSLPKSPK